MMFVLFGVNLCLFLSGSPDALIVSKVVFEYNIHILISLGMWMIALLFMAHLLLVLSDPARKEQNYLIANLIFDACS